MPISLSVNTRKEKAKKLKAEKNHQIPGVIYGPERDENFLFDINEQDFIKAYDQIGESGIIDLTMEGESEPVEVLIKEVQYDPVTDKPIHVDFYQIKRGQKIEAEKEINFINEAPAVKEFGGILMKKTDVIAFRCLPRELEKIDLTVDLSVLKTYDDVIYVKDINLPENVDLLSNPEDVIALVTEPREEEPEEVPTLEEEMEKVEVAGEGEKEEEGEEKETGKEEKSVEPEKKETEEKK